MLERIRQFIISESLIPPGCTMILAAVSGGVDSCVLMDILNRLKTELGFRLIMIHFNHRVRGPLSWEDEFFVRKIAEFHKTDIVVGRTRRVPRKRSETALRELRMQFFQRMLDRHPGAVIATGHNLNDRIETFIMRLAGGSRLPGLLGIRPKSGRLIHPLIREPRINIVQYARQRKIYFRQDKTNADTAIVRNRIRHRILPCLRRNLGNDIEYAIERSLKDLGEYLRVYEEKLRETIETCVKKVKGTLVLDRQRYAIHAPALRRGMLEYCISMVYPLNYKVSDRSLDQWDRFIASAQPGKKRTYLRKEIALAERKYIRFGDLEPEHRQERAILLQPGRKAVLSGRFKIGLRRVSRAEVKYSAGRNIEYIDAGAGRGKFLLRFWTRGDRFIPLGMKQKKKLSDFFIDQKISMAEKKQIPLVCRGNDIVWIAGYRLDDRFKVTDTTRKIYKLEIATTSKR